MRVLIEAIKYHYAEPREKFRIALSVSLRASGRKNLKKTLNGGRIGPKTKERMIDILYRYYGLDVLNPDMDVCLPALREARAMLQEMVARGSGDARCHA